eukprot:7854727-Lingulodinium_polyedra.AAC.1
MHACLRGFVGCGRRAVGVLVVFIFWQAPGGRPLFQHALSQRVRGCVRVCVCTKFPGLRPP